MDSEIKLFEVSRFYVHCIGVSGFGMGGFGMGYSSRKTLGCTAVKEVICDWPSGRVKPIRMNLGYKNCGIRSRWAVLSQCISQRSTNTFTRPPRNSRADF